MKLFTFNIRQGGGKRIDRIISAINKADADINVICEYRKGKNGEHLKSKLSEAGYDICVNPDVERNKNTVAIFSRLSFRYQRIDYDLGVYNIRAKQIEANGLTILGVHFPNRGKKKTMFEFLIDYVDKNKIRI